MSRKYIFEKGSGQHGLQEQPTESNAKLWIVKGNCLLDLYIFRSKDYLLNNFGSGNKDIEVPRNQTWSCQQKINSNIGTDEEIVQRK